jgi:hypothetical protein
MAHLCPAYLAGLFDGEGCVTISRKGRAHFYLRLQLRFNGLNLLQSIHNKYGGTLRPIKGLNRPLHDLYFSNQKARPIIEDMLPFSNLKTTQLQLSLVFLSLSKPGNGIWTDADVNIREQIRLRLKKLKTSLA